MDGAIDMMKKNMLFSMGALAYASEKTMEIVDDFVKKGDEALEKSKEWFKTTTKGGGVGDKKVNDQVAKTIEKMDIPTRKDFNELKKKLDEIAKKVK